MKGKNNERIVDLFTLTRAKLTVFDDLLCHLSYKYNDLLKKSVEDGEEQRRDYHTGELKWLDEEHTVPDMRIVYKEVPVTQEELDDNQFAQLKCIEQIIETLKKSF